MVLSETQPLWAGLTLFRVLRKGLWLCECLGGLLRRTNAVDETASRTRVPNLEPTRGVNDPPPWPHGSRTLVRLHGEHCWVVACSCFPES